MFVKGSFPFLSHFGRTKFQSFYKVVLWPKFKIFLYTMWGITKIPEFYADLSDFESALKVTEKDTKKVTYKKVMEK
jgi:hypothetical protein